MITKRLSIKSILLWMVGASGLMVLFYLGLQRGGSAATMGLLMFLVVVLAGFPVSALFLSEGNRQRRILALRKTVPAEYIQAMSAKQVLSGMTEEMVRLALGKPRRIEPQTTDAGPVMCWTYGQPRRPDRQLWFTGGKLTRFDP